GFGGTATTGDAARGKSNGGTSTGGFYAFNTAGALGTPDYAFGWQADDSDFIGGKVTLKLVNNTSEPITVLRIAYEAKDYNDQDNASQLQVAYSTDDITYTNISSLTAVSNELSDGGAVQWKSQNKSAIIESLTWAAGDSIYLQWTNDDTTAGATGQRDEMAIDDIIVRAYNADFLWDRTVWKPSEPTGQRERRATPVLAGDTATLASSASLRYRFAVNPNGKLKVDADLTVAPFGWCLKQIYQGIPR
ncbi:MAG: hypothetical protein U5L96_15465, partial [Owenweeksia sp.]|nr:hypothetical protein [Owenweeksia sp.]